MIAFGLDIGTTTVCGICCDIDTGEIYKSVTLINRASVESQYSWEKTQDAAALIALLKNAVSILTDECGRPDCIGVTGQMHGIVYTDINGGPVSPLYTWQDARGNLEYKNGKSYARYMSDKTKMNLAAGFGAVTHFYNKVNNLVPENAHKFCTIHDLAVMALCGRRTPLVHISDAASFGLYNIQSAEFDIAAIRSLGLEPDIFPETVGGFEVAGRTEDGVPVCVAVGDNQAGVIGSVKDFGSSVLVNVGTGSQISAVISGYMDAGELEIRPLYDEYYLLTGPALCGGRAYSVLEKFLRDIAQKVTGEKVESAYPAMDRLMAQETEKGEPLTVSTLFAGNRQSPELRGSIGNISTENFTMRNICQGVLEGISEELYNMYKEMQKLMPETPKRLICSGNGIRSNAALLKTLRDMFSMPPQIPVHLEEAAFGAALISMTASGCVSDLRQAQELITLTSH